MVEIHDTHEQSEIVKSWLKENGGAIVLGLVLAFGSLFGVKQWKLWQQNKHQIASAEYTLVAAFLMEGNLDAAVANFETLKKEHANSTYTALAALQMAKARLDAGQLDLAAQLLEQAMNDGRPDAVRIIARERLARVLLDRGQADEALELLNSAPSQAGFEPQFAEIKGDIFRSKGDSAEAARFYREALDLLEAGTGNRAFLEIKLEALGLGGKEPDGAS